MPPRLTKNSDQEARRLQNRIGRFAIIGILVTGVAVGMAAATPFYLQLRAQSEMTTGFQLQSQAQLISQHFVRLADVARQLTSRTQIRKRLEQYNRGEVSLDNLVAFSTSRLEDAMVQSGDIIGLVRLDAHDNAVIEIGTTPAPAHWPALPHDAVEPLFGSPLIVDGTPLLIVAAPIHDHRGERVGTDIVSFRATTLSQILGDSSALGEDARQFLLSYRHGIRIASTSPQSLLTIEPLREQMTMAQAVTDKKVAKRVLDDDTVLFATTIPDKADWSLLVQRDKANLYQPALQQLLPPLITVALMVFSGIALTTRIIQPLASRVVSTTRDLTELNHQQQSLLELAHGFTFQQDAEGVITHASPGVEQVLGIPPGAFPLHQDELLTDNPMNASLTVHQQVLLNLGVEPAPFTIELRHHDGHRVVLEISARPLREHGKIIGLDGVARDVTHRSRNEERQRLAASVFQGSQEGIMILDTELRILEVNHAFSRITGYDKPSISGRRLRELLVTDHGPEQTCSTIIATLVDKGTWQGEVWYRNREGRRFPAWQNMSAVKDEQGEIVQYIAIFTDISEKRAYEERIRHMALHDQLTDLPNRVLLEERLHSALARMHRAQKRLAVLFLDLDRFKNINDSLGHPVGDKLLQQVASRLEASVRKQDTVARLSGDEFLVVIEGLEEPAYAADVARKILQHIRQSIRIDEHDLIIGASIGISLYPDDGDSPETLIKNADTALYRAKETGRNNYHFYIPELTEQSLERFELERDLRRALEQQELVVHYQPQVSAHTHRCVGVEALVRWQHPQRGLVPPDKFIPLAEETGLILPLGRQVLERACQQAKAWQ
ncbi:MAG: bifunctional diguanylate cyclase/phosphodiesterase, partial [Pseudomonadota bacterium]